MTSRAHASRPPSRLVGCAAILAALGGPMTAARAAPASTTSTSPLPDGRELVLRQVVYERRSTEPIGGMIDRLMRFERTLAVRSPGGHVVPLARWEGWRDDAEAAGGAFREIVLASPGGTEALIVHSAAHHDGVYIGGGYVRVPDSVAGSPARTMLNEVLDRGWQINVPRGPLAPVPTEIRVASAGSMIAVWLNGPDGPIAELAIDPVTRKAVDLIGGRINARWDYGAELRAFEDAARAEPSELKAPDPVAPAP